MEVITRVETGQLLDYVAGPRWWRFITIDGRVLTVPYDAIALDAQKLPTIRFGQWATITWTGQQCDARACDAPAGADALKGLLR